MKCFRLCSKLRLLSFRHRSEDEDSRQRFRIIWPDLSASAFSQDLLLRSVKQVHREEYIDFLATIYDAWCKEGGSKVRILFIGIWTLTSLPTLARAGRRSSRDIPEERPATREGPGRSLDCRRD